MNLPLSASSAPPRENKSRWVTKNLGDVCNVIGGGTPPKDKAVFYSGDIPWATVRDLKQEVITSTEFKITKEAVKSSSTNIIPSGNVVIATRVGLGKVCLLGQDTAINQDLRGITLLCLRLTTLCMPEGALPEMWTASMRVQN